MTVNNIGSGQTPAVTSNSTGTQGVNGTGTAATDSTSQNTSQKSSSTTNDDTVQISSQAVDLKALEKIVSDLPDVDISRVEEIRSRLESGQYEINTERVAEKILGFEAGL